MDITDTTKSFMIKGLIFIQHVRKIYHELRDYAVRKINKTEFALKFQKVTSKTKFQLGTHNLHRNKCVLLSSNDTDFASLTIKTASSCF